MAKRINQLTETSTIANDSVFAMDSATTAGKTNKVTYTNLRNAIVNSMSISSGVITTSSTFKSIYYSNTQYIESGCYTKSYFATANCIVFWHIEWDCSGTDGLTLEIINSSGTVKGSLTIMRNAELNDSIWMNRNGEVPLGKGMGLRFRAERPLLTQSGNSLSYLVVTV